jgi:endogenous inhibitor of DNA gyrase (YacG/DUF329 family)
MKTRTIVISVVLACGGLLVLLVIAGVGIVFYIYSNADTATSPKIDALFAAIDNGTFGQTYLTETTPEFRQALSREKYEEIGRLVKSRLGPLGSKTLTQFNAKWFNGENIMDVVYSATFQKGSATIRASFKSVGGQWRLQGFYVESPEFLKDQATVKCPYCGEPVSLTAKFCPHCGKAIANHDQNKPPPISGGTQTKRRP